MIFGIVECCIFFDFNRFSLVNTMHNDASSYETVSRYSSVSCRGLSLYITLSGRIFSYLFHISEDVLNICATSIDKYLGKNRFEYHKYIACLKT